MAKAALSAPRAVPRAAPRATTTTTTLHSQASQAPEDYAGDDAYDVLSEETPVTSSSSSSAPAAAKSGGRKPRPTLAAAAAGVKAPRAPPKKRVPLTDEQKAAKKARAKEEDAAAVAQMRAQKLRIASAKREAYDTLKFRINPSAVRAMYRFLGAQRVSDLAVQCIVVFLTRECSNLFKRATKITLMRNGRTVSVADMRMIIGSKQLVSFQA